MKTAVLIGLSRHRIGVDGSGVTTLVAFHGCPLNCKYCLNPQALSPEGIWKRFTPEELYKAVSKDDLYFRATGGGITFGGGEPLISCKEILHFRSICLKNGKKWKINIETSLNVPKTLDMNPHIYKAYTGKDNKQVISNLQYLIDNNAKITARVPLIAGFNTELDVKNSILSLERMGIIDIDRFTYTVKKH